MQKQKFNKNQQLFQSRKSKFFLNVVSLFSQIVALFCSKGEVDVCVYCQMGFRWFLMLGEQVGKVRFCSWNTTTRSGKPSITDCSTRLSTTKRTVHKAPAPIHDLGCAFTLMVKNLTSITKNHLIYLQKRIIS